MFGAGSGVVFTDAVVAGAPHAATIKAPRVRRVSEIVRLIGDREWVGKVTGVVR